MEQRWPMWLGLAVAIGAVAAGFALGDGLQDQWQHAARYTARVGFPLLIVAYIARPLHQLAPSGFSKGALARRRWIGLGFAISHTIHLVALATALRLAGQAPDPVTVIGGGLAYVLLYAMAFTSTDRARRAMGKWWKRLHRFGIHYLWFIFAQSYLGRVFDPGTRGIGVMFGSIALAAAGIRLAAWLKGRQARNMAAA
jgi:DMSO/TMAO reductase YedYZ heme-binding membrane subunit